MSVKPPNQSTTQPQPVRIYLSFEERFNLSKTEELLVQVLRPVIILNGFIINLSIETITEFNEQKSQYERESKLKIRSYKIINGSKVDEELRYFPIRTSEEIKGILRRAFPRSLLSQRSCCF